MSVPSRRSRARTPPSPSRILSSPGVLALGGAVGIVLLLSLSLLPPLRVLPTHPQGPAPSPGAVAPSRAAWAVHQGHAVPARSGNGPGITPAGNGTTTYEVCNFGEIINGTNPPPQPGYCFNFTLANSTTCAAPPTNATLADLGLNLTVSSTPFSGIAPAPLNFTWNITINGGGLPPYYVQIAIYNAALTFISANLTGSIALTLPGLYQVDVMAVDASCSQTAYAAFPLDAYDPSIGPSPVSISATANSSTVPAAVGYQVNMSGLPANLTVLWTTPGFFGQMSVSGTANQTYFLPGTYHASACLDELDVNGSVTGVILACGISPALTFGGASPVVTNVSVAPGPFPTNVTFSVTDVAPGLFPNDTELSLLVRASDGTGTWNLTNNTSVSMTVPAGCGHPWTTYVPPNGICSVVAVFSLLDPSRSVDAGELGFGVLVANLTGNGTPALWNPSVSYSYTALNGSLPFNLTVNLTATNGQPPYAYSTVLYGRASGAANATRYPTLNGTTSGWNGSAISLVFSFNRTGVYFLSVFVADSNDAWVGFSLPLVILGNVSAFRPLTISATGGSGGTAPGTVTAGASTPFLATASGGVGPYAVQWDFGDGSYGSSLPGVPVYHIYQFPGVYRASVTVTDGRGEHRTSTLAPLTVAPASRSPNGGGPTGGSSGEGLSVVVWGPVVWAAAVGVALLAMGALAAREVVRRQGEALVAGIEPNESSPVDAPSRPDGPTDDDSA